MTNKEVLAINEIDYSLLKKMPDEPDRAYQGFREYCRLGVSRSHHKLIAKFNRMRKEGITPPCKSRATISNWSVAFNWVKRVSVWDMYQADRLDEKWRNRRVKLLEDDWKAGEKLRSLADKVLKKTPKFIHAKREIIKDDSGNVIKEIVREKIDVRVIINALKTASELQRLSVGFTDKVVNNNLTLTQDNRSIDVNFEGLDEQELLAIIDEFRLGNPSRNEHITISANIS